MLKLATPFLECFYVLMTRYTLLTLYLTSDPKRLLGKLKNNEVSQGLLQIKIEKNTF